MTVLIPPAPAAGQPPSRWRRELLDLLASMRFAIALLTVICIASAIGTVVKQGEPLGNYVEQFGPFWAEVFGALGLYRIYSSAWFLLILAFLVVSTSLCVARNTPKILADWRNHKEYLREQALAAFHHRASGQLAQPLAHSQARVLALLGEQGWSVKSQARQASASGGEGVMLGARLGAANKLGYIAAHSAIVLICLGGLFDGDLVVQVQAWAQGLQPFKGGAEPAHSRLSVQNPAYRAQLFVPEGQRSGAAVVTLQEGMLVQPLPFEVELRRFVVDYYDTGMPKRFASEVLIHDPLLAQPLAYTIEVNHPVTHRGVTLFQSSFEDGGSRVQLQPLLFDGPVGGPLPTPVQTTVGAAGLPLPAAWWGTGPAAAGWQLEVTGLRVINVEDLAQADGARGAGGPKGSGSEDTLADPPPSAQTPGSTAAPATDVRGVNLAALTRQLGSGARPQIDKQLSNIGPAVTYKLRDAAGQAREYQNYMLPVRLGGQSVFLLGVRDTPAESFRYLRVPADEAQTLQGWWRLRQALGDAALRQEAAQRFAHGAAPPERPELRAQLAASAQKALEVFAGAVPLPGAPAGQPMGGLQALSLFIEQVVPSDQRERASGTLVRLLNGTLFELLQLSRERVGLPRQDAAQDEVRSFMTQAVLSLSDAVFYPAPLVLTLSSFEQRQASVLQVTRTPGRNVVYLGCVLLIVGVFAMLYIRERRLWVWLQDDGQGGTRVQMALSSTRHTLDTDGEFDRLRNSVLGA